MNTEPDHTQQVDIGGSVLQVRDLCDADEQALLQLHVRVFGPGANAAWYAWKYRAGGGLGSGVWYQGELIAHCGGVPRTLWRQGRRVGGIQIGDVLVAPEWRGILTRRGPFFQASHRFYSAHVGATSGHSIAFGFPSERHMRLAVMLKLAWDAGPIHALSWRLIPDPAAQTIRAWRWSPLDPAEAAFDGVIGAAWHRMQASASNWTIGERGASYVRWRYCDRPDRGCSLFTLRRPWSSEPVGVAVLDLSGTEARWLDWIGDPGKIAVARRACAAEAARGGATRMVAWCSAAVTQCLQDSGVEHLSITARLGIPRASALTQDEVARMGWWFMGGDTDFL